MAQSDKQLRASLYFSRRKDEDIINEIDFENLDKGDINWEIKSLMRDGIKFRQVGYSDNESITMPSHKAKSYITVNQDISDTLHCSSELEEEFGEIILQRKELNEEDILGKLNSI